MTRIWISAVLAAAVLTATSGLAQDNSGGATTSGGVTSEPAVPTAPNAPLQATDQGPLPPGEAAGTTTASNWLTDPVTLGIGAVVIGAAVCLAVCDTGQSTSSTTKTTSK